MSVTEMIEEICKMGEDELNALNDYIDAMIDDAEIQCTSPHHEVAPQKARRA